MSRDLFGAWDDLRASLVAGLEEDPSGCLLWTGKVDRNGYGITRGARSHRLAYALATGVWETALVIDHLCGVRTCCHPDHLEAVEREENARRVWTVEGNPTEGERKPPRRRIHAAAAPEATVGRALERVLERNGPLGLTQSDLRRAVTGNHHRTVVPKVLAAKVADGTLRVEGRRYWRAA